MTDTTTHPPLVGQRAPVFSGQALLGEDIKAISLSDFEGKWKILFFYPLDFTFVCPTEIVAFSERISLFEKLNTQVIGCSVDSEFSHLKWAQTPRREGGLGGIAYPLLSDLDKKVAKDYGVLVDNSVALRATFIIDNEDIIQHASINNLSVGRNVEELARLVEAYQYTAAHGEVCPAGWTSGGDTMKPDPVGSREYFKKL